MKTATNRELLPPQIRNFADFFSKYWQISAELHGFVPFLFLTPLPYQLLFRIFSIFRIPYYYMCFWIYRHKKGTLLAFENSTFGTKRELFRFSLLKMAYPYPLHPCWSPWPRPYNPRHRYTWGCSRICSCRMQQPYWVPHTGVWPCDRGFPELV